MKAKIYYTVVSNGTANRKSVEYTVSPSVSSDGWQFVSTTFVPPQAESGQTVTVELIDVYVVNESISPISFDDISLVMNTAVCRKFTENGDILEENDFLGNKTTYNYGEDGRLAAKTTEYTQTTYSYDDTAKTTTETTTEYDVPNTAENRNAKTVSVTKKDRYDNIILSTVSYTESSVYTYSEYTYDEKYNYVISEKDGRGNTKSYTYDAHGNKISETDEKGNITRFEYDTNGAIVRMYHDKDKNGVGSGDDRIVDYTYTAAGKTSAIHTNGQTYYYYYTSSDATKIASMIFGESEIYSYEYNNDKISKILYLNGDSVNFLYNNLDKIVDVSYNKENTIENYSYTYNSDGLLEKVWISGMGA